MTVTVTATVEASNIPPRVKLAISSTSETSTTATRTNPDGTVVNVRTNDGNPLPLSGSGTKTGTLYDYEVPYGQAVTFSTLETPASVTAPVTVSVAAPWLVHPGVPTRSLPIDLRVGTLAEETYGVGQAVYYPMGRANPIVVTEGARRGAQSSLVISAATLAQVQSLRTLVADAGVLLLNASPALGLGIDTRYIAVGEVKVGRVSNVGADTLRDVTLPFVQVDRPAGGSQATRTLADLLVYPTLADLARAYPTLAALEAGP